LQNPITHTHSHTHAHTATHRHTQTHTDTHRHTQTHTQTQAHTKKPILPDCRHWCTKHRMTLARVVQKNQAMAHVCDIRTIVSNYIMFYFK